MQRLRRRDLSCVQTGRRGNNTPIEDDEFRGRRGGRGHGHGWRRGGRGRGRNSVVDEVDTKES